jgi:hypothetical protein
MMNTAKAMETKPIVKPGEIPVAAASRTVRDASTERRRTADMALRDALCSSTNRSGTAIMWKRRFREARSAGGPVASARDLNDAAVTV